MKKKAAKKSPMKKKTRTSGPSTVTEQGMLAILQALTAKGAGVAELREIVASMAGMGPGDGFDDSAQVARDNAQEIAFDAMEAQSDAQARKLARRAVAMDPDCVDALALLARLDAASSQEEIVALQAAAAAGERALGARFIRDNKGDFWGLLETRPYMRVLAQLADRLSTVGAHREAIQRYETMLGLNPNDNQGVRDPLLCLYLMTNDLKGAGKLLKKYKNDTMANFQWCRVLERFLSEDRAGAEAALQVARKTNRHVELYLSGRKPLPKRQPASYSLGSNEEAVICLDTMMPAWAHHKQAMHWLLDRLLEKSS